MIDLGNCLKKHYNDILWLDLRKKCSNKLWCGCWDDIAIPVWMDVSDNVLDKIYAQMKEDLWLI
jgi:hypothetical protein